jgi:hypothetical protein
MLDPFFYQIAFAPEPQTARVIPISEDPQIKRAILAVATLSAVWLMVYMAPDIRHSWRTRAL